MKPNKDNASNPVTDDTQDCTQTLSRERSLNPRLRTLSPADLAKIVGKKESTLKKELTTNPGRYPPRFRPPGSNKILWLESVVIAWVDKVQNGTWEAPKRRTGRRRQVPA
jgi:hypothetical protein